MRLTSFNTISSKPEILTSLFHVTKVSAKNLEITGNITFLLNQNYSILAFNDNSDDILDISNKLKANLIKTKEKIELKSMVDESINITGLAIISISIIIPLTFMVYKKYCS